MSVKVHCDQCDKAVPESSAVGWYHLEQDPGRWGQPPGGWWFCSRGCLATWAMARHEKHEAMMREELARRA